MRILGSHILEGMGITLKHFVDSYVEDFKRWRGRSGSPQTELRQPLDIRGIVTVNYPEEHLKPAERFRALPVLIYEADHGEVRCTSCGICAKVCPPQCIWIVQAATPDGKIKPKPAEFFIDMDVCMNCGFCAEFCPFDAIKMDHNFETSNYERDKSHVFNLQDLLVSTEYYAKTHPTAWAEEEEKRRKKTEKKPAAKPPAAPGAVPPMPPPAKSAAAVPPMPPPARPAAAVPPMPPPARPAVAPAVKAEAEQGIKAPSPQPAPGTTAAEAAGQPGKPATDPGRLGGSEPPEQSAPPGPASAGPPAV